MFYIHSALGDGSTPTFFDVQHTVMFLFLTLVAALGIESRNVLMLIVYANHMTSMEAV
jgi:hypothetical protein